MTSSSWACVQVSSGQRRRIEIGYLSQDSFKKHLQMFGVNRVGRVTGWEEGRHV